MLPIRVTITDMGDTIASYTMDHDDPAQRRVLGEQCRNAFEAGQSVRTEPTTYTRSKSDAK